MVHTGTVVPVLQSDDKRGIVRAGSGHHTIAAYYSEALQFRNILHLSLHFLHHFAGLLQRGTLRGLYLSQEHALVLLWHEARRQTLHEEHQQHGGQSQQAPSQNGALDELLYAFAIFFINGVVAHRIGLLGVIGQALAFLLSIRHAHHDGAEGRTECQGRYARQTDGRGNRHTELGEESA